MDMNEHILSALDEKDINLITYEIVSQVKVAEQFVNLWHDNRVHKENIILLQSGALSFLYGFNFFPKFSRRQSEQSSSQYCCNFRNTIYCLYSHIVYTKVVDKIIVSISQFLVFIKLDFHK